MKCKGCMNNLWFNLIHAYINRPKSHAQTQKFESSFLIFKSSNLHSWLLIYFCVLVDVCRWFVTIFDTKVRIFILDFQKFESSFMIFFFFSCDGYTAYEAFWFVHMSINCCRVHILHKLSGLSSFLLVLSI